MHKTQKEVVETALGFYFDHIDSVVADNVVKKLKVDKMQLHDSKDVYKELAIEI